MEVACRLSECLFAAGACLHIDRGKLPTIHYGLADSGVIIIEGEAAFELVPHMLVVAPANKSIDIVAARGGLQRSNPILIARVEPLGSTARFDLSEKFEVFAISPALKLIAMNEAQRR